MNYFYFPNTEKIEPEPRLQKILKSPKNQFKNLHSYFTKKKLKLVIKSHHKKAEGAEEEELKFLESKTGY